jgi:hypothetical protein
MALPWKSRNAAFSLKGPSTRTFSHPILYPIPYPISCISDGDTILCPRWKSSINTQKKIPSDLPSDSLSPKRYVFPEIRCFPVFLIRQQFCVRVCWCRTGNWTENRMPMADRWRLVSDGKSDRESIVSASDLHANRTDNRIRKRTCWRPLKGAFTLPG